MKFSRKKINEEVDSEGSWAVSYGDMVTLLLCFFVIFFTTDLKKDKIEQLNRHLSFNLDIMAAEITKDSQKKKVEDIKNLDDMNVKVHRDNENLVITFGKQSFFNSGRTEVRKEVTFLLEKFVEKYLPYAGNYNLSIKGFTDKRPVIKEKRRYDDNLELSALRAISAMRELQRLGIPLRRMEIAGVGEMKSIEKIIPKAEDLTIDEVNALSRTIVIVIKPEKETWL